MLLIVNYFLRRAFMLHPVAYKLLLFCIM